MSLGIVLGYLGIALALLSCFMRSMQPLRMVAIIGNLVGMTYGYLDSVWPAFFGNLLLLPINAVRLWEIRKLIRDMESASRDTPIAELLLPHMKLKKVAAGTLLFSRGDHADEMLYIQSGEIRLIELDRTLGPGSLFGEVGLFARDSKRTQSVECKTDCELYSMTQEQLYLLYYQNPKIGFTLIRVIIDHFLPNKQPVQS